jgi:hypothetical protein
MSAQNLTTTTNADKVGRRKAAKLLSKIPLFHLKEINSPLCLLFPEMERMPKDGFAHIFLAYE